MTGTLCPWTADCIPEHPGFTTFTVLLWLAVIALALNDHIGDD